MGRAPNGRGGDEFATDIGRAFTVPERERERTSPGADAGAVAGVVTISKRRGDSGSASEAVGLGSTATMVGTAICSATWSSVSSLRSMTAGRRGGCGSAVVGAGADGAGREATRARGGDGARAGDGARTGANVGTGGGGRAGAGAGGGGMLLRTGEGTGEAVETDVRIGAVDRASERT